MAIVFVGAFNCLPGHREHSGGLAYAVAPAEAHVTHKRISGRRRLHRRADVPSA